MPILNLIQHVRHAEDWSIQSRYLEPEGDPALRQRRGRRRGHGGREPWARSSSFPTASTCRSFHDPAAIATTDDLLIAGLKQPVLADAASPIGSLAPGRTIEVLTDYVPRETFLNLMRRARVTLFLPNEEEGFYLPALEGMAVGTIVVCPDCVGNRSFCLPGVNAFRPNYRFDDLVRATEAALTLPPAEATRLISQCRRHRAAA